MIWVVDLKTNCQSNPDPLVSFDYLGHEKKGAGQRLVQINLSNIGTDILFK